MINSEKKSSETPKIKDLIGKLWEIQLGLKQNLANLQQKIETLESEPKLSTILENAKKDAESRASNLEGEIKQLREELNDIKDLLGSNIEKKEPS
jgi:uncharacterized phage infection (PIP) family protein YhgE